MKALRIIAILLVLGLSQEIFCQEIEIELTFIGDSVIYPFETVDKISELSMEGLAILNNDTSLVRVILQDENGFQYMIFETYTLICPNKSIAIKSYCDETCALDMIHPVSLIIQVFDAELYLDSLTYAIEAKSNPSQLQFEAKRTKDAEKITFMNQQIPIYGMNWIPADNSEVAMYYDQKRIIYGDAYNLKGYEYYAGGVFEFLGHREYPKVDPDFVRSFDWRNRHGANNPQSDYWDGDNYGTGWFSRVKDQGECGSCWAFSATGVVEAIANLYAVDSVDIDLSEQHLVSCCQNSNGCKGGEPEFALEDIQSEIVTRQCIPYYHEDTPCYGLMCSYPDSIINIQGYFSIPENFDSIRLALIKNGPLTFEFKYDPNSTKGHAVALSGFRFDPVDSTVIWIYKDSKGLGVAPNYGFMEVKLENVDDNSYAIEPPVFVNGDSISRHCYDKDNDGLYFWGVGTKPDTLGSQVNEDCDDSNPYLGGYDENYKCQCLLEMDPNVVHITSDTTWTGSIYVNYILVIETGAKLTISAHVEFAPEAKIIVKTGAELVLNNGYLTKACEKLWNGIEVWGSPSSIQSKTYQGAVTLINSTIEFADTAIYTGRTLSGRWAGSYAGGIVSCHNSTFRDNVYDVIFKPYRNIVYELPIEYPNVSSFSKVNFLTTSNLYLYAAPEAHIQLTEVYGLSFFGCKFENLWPITYSPFYSLGTGIYSLDATFILDKYCNNPLITPCPDLEQCEFTNLEYGIKALNSWSSKTLDIEGVYFNQNVVGISLSGINYASVLSNKFYCRNVVKDINDDRFIGGLFLEGCNGYHIEADTFYRPLMTNNDSGVYYGIGIKNSGSENNEIYRNKFSKLYTGIICMGENKGREAGLCLNCNEMDLNKNDFIVDSVDNPPLGHYQGIAYYQGNPDDSISMTAPAGNTFTPFNNQPADTVNNLYWNYFNSAENIWYVHHHRQTTPYLTYPYDNNYTQATIALDEQSIVFNKSLACPSRIEEENLKSYTDPRLIIQEADNYISLHSNQLVTLVDGGNTEALNLDVITSQPDESLEIRQQLLNDSPYLSDTILKQAIYKEDVLPNAMVRDIMKANPHSAKTVAVLSALDDREEPMPDYMMAQIMNGKEYLGAKELLEAQIQYWQQVRARAKSALIRQFLLDTILVNPFDSVITFLESENDIQSDYDLAFAYWNKLDTGAAMMTLNNIPIEYELSDIQNAEHQQYDTYINIVGQLMGNNLNASELDSSNVLQLFNLMESDNADISARSRGLLVKGGFYNYVERVTLPHYSNSNMQFYSTKISPVVPSPKDNLRLFPNPAGDYVIAYYDIEDMNDNSHIIIRDIKGAILKNYEINPGENQMVLDIKDLPNGIYIISLLDNFQLLESKKLSKGAY